MLPLLIAATLCVTPERVETYASATAAATALADEMQTGTLLFTSGDCLAIKVFTASRYTHVGAVVVRDGRPMVYESTNGIGVRCVTLERYLGYQAADVFYVFQPTEPLSDECAAAFEDQLDSQLGRPYSILHHVTGQRAEGVHCSEYVTDALSSAGMLHVRSAPRVSPAKLATKILSSGLYEPEETVMLLKPVAVPIEGENWCARLWSQSKRRTLEYCDQVGRWFCCK